MHTASRGVVFSPGHGVKLPESNGVVSYYSQYQNKEMIDMILGHTQGALEMSIGDKKYINNRTWTRIMKHDESILIPHVKLS